MAVPDQAGNPDVQTGSRRPERMKGAHNYEHLRGRLSPLLQPRGSFELLHSFLSIRPDSTGGMRTGLSSEGSRSSISRPSSRIHLGIPTEWTHRPAHPNEMCRCATRQGRPQGAGRCCLVMVSTGAFRDFPQGFVRARGLAPAAAATDPYLNLMRGVFEGTDE